jgi:hypothetical protein
MIKPILEEFFAVTFVLVALWIAGRASLSLYTKFRDVTKNTEEKKK